MNKKRLVLSFPPQLVEQPVTYHLIKDFDLMINILRANVTAEAGRLVIEIEGEKGAIDKGIKYLAGLGVKIEALTQDIKWHKEKCTHCTACIPICPAAALVLDRKNMLVSFDNKKCIMCGLCISVCPYKAIELNYP